MLIAERFLLLCCDPVKGVPQWPRQRHDTPLLAAAALALDLAVQERLDLRDGRLHADAGLPVGHPLLNDALHALAREDLPAPDALRALAHRFDPLPLRILDGLHRRDLVHRLVRRDWLLRKRVRYPLRSVQARNETLHLLAAAAHGEDAHGLALLLLIDASGLLAVHLRAHDHEAAMRRVFAAVREALLA